MNKLGTKLGAVAMSAVMALSFAPSAAITSLAAGGDDLTDATQELSTPVYRLYNPNSGEHLFTTNENECDSLDKNGWDYETIAWYAPSTGDPVFRLYNPNHPLGDHHYTSSEEERDNLIKQGWKLDATAFNTVAEGELLGAPVYSLYNPNAYDLGMATHHLTLSEEEADGLELLGWTNEGPKFYEYAEDLDPEVEELTVSIDNTTPKVGDTLTAIVSDGTAGTGTYTYKWTLNGKGAVTTETYEVPATANTGDAIKVTVTNEAGDTAEDTVYVGGFTILKVEPTTDAVTGTGATGYKYIRAYFSSALTSLAPEDIELRDKDTEQLYSIDTVKLSSDGTYADITLFGSVQEGGTTFLQPQTIYTMKVTTTELSDSYEFELPLFTSNLLVTKVNTSKGQIFFGGNTGYEVGDVYSDNLGTLVGRSVNVGRNSDNEIEKLSVKKAEVVYGVMKYVNKDGDDTGASGISDKDYFEDQVTKTKYYMTTAGTTTINASRAIQVVDGDTLDYDLSDRTYDYAKLVLNSNGTVACAVLDPWAWAGGSVKVADVDGTIVDETSKTSVDFDGYTIEKNGAYVTTADLEEDDIIFYNGNDDNKFAEVYTVTVEGEPSDIDSKTIKIDGTSYKWNAGDDTIVAAKYYNADDDVYKVLLAGTTEAQNVAAQKILANFDPELGVTAYLDRRGNIAYIEGTDKEDAVTTDTWYVTTSDGQGYSQALASYLKFKVSDGKEQTIEIPVSQIKKFNGVKGKLTRIKADDTYPTSESAGTAGTADAGAEGGTYQLSFVPAKTDDAGDAFKNVAANALVEKGVLVKVTRDEDGKVIGLTFPGYDETAADTYDWINTIDGKTTNGLTADSAKVTTAGGSKAQLADATNIWVYTVDNSNDGAISVSKTAFADYAKSTYTLAEGGITAAAPAVFGPFVLLKGSTVTDVLLRETINAAEESNTFKEGATSTIEGIITGYTEKMNKDKDGNFVNTITVKGIDNTDVAYTTLDESIVGDPGKGVYAEIKLDKATGDIAEVNSGWTAWGTVRAVGNTSSSTEINTAGGQAIKLAPESLVLKWNGSKYSVMKLNQIAATTKDLKVSWHDEYLNTTEESEMGTIGVHYADFVVVEETDVLPAAEIVLDSLAGDVTFAQNAEIADLTVYDDEAGDVLTYALEKYDSATSTWIDTTVAVGANAAEDKVVVTDAAGWDLTASTLYRITVTTTNADYDPAESNVESSDDATFDAITAGAGTATLSGLTVTGTAPCTMDDQFGNAYTGYSLTDKAMTQDSTSAEDGITSAKLSVTYDDDTDKYVATVVMTGTITASTADEWTYDDTTNGITWTLARTDASTAVWTIIADDTP